MKNVFFVYIFQCLKLSFYFVHSRGAFPHKLCTRKLLHAPSQYIAIINSSKNVHTPGAHLQKLCTRLRKCARRVQGAPLISDTDFFNKNISLNISSTVLKIKVFILDTIMEETVSQIFYLCLRFYFMKCRN